MAKVKLRLYKSKKRKDGSSPVVIQLSSGDERRMIFTKLYATEEQWDPKLGNINYKKHPAGRKGFLSLQRDLDEWRRKVMMAELDGFRSGSGLLDYVMKPKEDEILLVEFIQEIIEDQLAKGSPGNAKVYNTLRDQLLQFRPRILLSEVDYDLVHRFKYFKYSSGISNNALHNYLRTFRSVINQAINRGLYDANRYPFRRGMMPRLEPTEKKALSLQELRKLYAYKPKGIRQEKAWKLLILCFELRGLDMIDILEITSKEIRGDRIVKRRAKTGQLVSIKMSDNAKQWLRNPGRFKFPLLDHKKNEDPKHYATRTNNVMREGKRIAEELGIDSGLRLKVMRHTFATVGKHLGCTREIMAELLGHSSSTVTEIYQSPYPLELLDQWQEQIIKTAIN